MKKKLLAILLALMAAGSLAFGLTACNSISADGGNTSSSGNSVNSGNGNNTGGGNTSSSGNSVNSGNGNNTGGGGEQSASTTYSKGLIYYLHEENNQYYAIGIGSCKDAEIYIPSVHDGKPVTLVYEMFIVYTDIVFGNPEYSDIMYHPGHNTTVTKVVISEGITGIVCAAFVYCDNLKSVTLPNSIEIMDDSIFYGCYSLTDIYFNGTKEQWEAIDKMEGWDNETGDYVIHCTDGDIAKS